MNRVRVGERVKVRIRARELKKQIEERILEDTDGIYLMRHDMTCTTSTNTTLLTQIN
jgi:hypothetical protein